MKVKYFLIMIIIVILLYSIKYSYAMFNKDININNVANISTYSFDTDSSIIEYEKITIPAGEEKIIKLNVTNSTDNSLYYGVWYEMVDPQSINSDIIVAKYYQSINDIIGQINTNITKSVSLYIANNTDNNIILRIGVGYSETSSLNLTSGRILITDEYTEPNPPELVQGLIPVKWSKKSCSNITDPNLNLHYDCYDTEQTLSWMNNAIYKYCEDTSSCRNAENEEQVVANCASLVYNAGDSSVECEVIGTVTKTKVINWGEKYGLLNGEKTFNANNEVLLPVKADNTNLNKTWYDYGERRWANAVLVSSESRNSYNNASVGSDIEEDDILAYYVWIPRYKYKVFNINKQIGFELYKAYENGIDIRFENGKQNTGTISCSYDHSIVPTSTIRNETCTGANGEYYTHPGFTLGNTELSGIWVGKYEISNELETSDKNESYTDQLTLRIKPSVKAWHYNDLSNYFKVIYNMQESNNIYGLSTDRNNTDSHLIKNMEWGTIAYFTNSRFGRCRSDGCLEVMINNSRNYYTGNAATLSVENRPGIVGPYNTQKGGLASTTGNIYGIYDMSGGLVEYVMGNMSSEAGTYTYYAANAGNNFTYTGNEKYIDTYSFDNVYYYGQQGYNRSRLGDATGETVGWYDDSASFVYSDHPWFGRGGSYGVTSSAGIFDFSPGKGIGYNTIGGTTRAILVATGS